MKLPKRIFCSGLTLLLAAAVAVAEEDAARTTASGETREGEIFGRGVSIDGDSDKYREDYDDLQSGGGFRARTGFEDEDGAYGAIAGSFLFAEHGNAFDAAEMALSAGQRDRYRLKGKFSLLQSYFDDSREGRFRGFPDSNALGRDLHTNRADIDAEGDLFLGNRGRLGFHYIHRENNGDRSTLKGSHTETFSPVSFRAPAYQGVNTRVDGIDVDAVLPAGGVQIGLVAGYRNETNKDTTNEINYSDSAVRDRVRFRDKAEVNAGYGAVSVAADSNAAIQGNAGYQVSYVGSDGSSSQRVGPMTGATVTVRSTDDVDVDTWAHTGHSGLVFHPRHDLSVRVAHVARYRDRTANSTENRVGISGDSSQLVSNRTDQETLSNSPRVSLNYSGLPRTRLQASYRFDQVHRDINFRSNPEDGGLSAITHIQRTDEDVYRHSARIAAWTRLARRVRGEVGYHLVREDIDESVKELVNESTLGSRDRERDRVYAKIRVRATRQTSILLSGEYEHSCFNRTDIPGDSSTEVDGYRIDAQVHSQPFADFSTQAVFSYIDRDYKVGDKTDRTLSSFRDIEFHDRSTVGTLLASWSPIPELALRGRYSAAAASASLDNLSQRVHGDVSYRATDRIRLSTGYSFLGFDEDSYFGDDYDTHLAWAGVDVEF